MTIKSKKVVIIDYQMGNVASVKKAFEKTGADVKISNSKKDIERAEFLVLPGVGAFGDGMANLTRLGLIDVLNRAVIKNRTPFLGICLGMQLLSEEGHEFGSHKGLGWVKGTTVKLKSDRLPHIGWNEIKILKSNLFKEIPDKNFYFVHSYVLKLLDKQTITSTAKYGVEFPSSIQYKNIFATQFHPEKSQLAGLKLLENFLNA